MQTSIYLVQWLDSASVEGWSEADEYATPILCTTAGYLLHEDDASIFVAQTQDENGRWTGGMAIPRLAIKSMQAWSPSADS